MPTQSELAETVIVQRVEDKLTAAAPGFDPLIITTLIDTLMEILSGMCGGGDVTPEEAVERATKLTPFQQRALRSKLKRNAQEAKVKDARHISGMAADAVTAVAKEATPEERLEFARAMQPIKDIFDVF